MRIDSHQHFWYYHPIRESWIPDEMSRIRKDFLPGDLEPLLLENNMEGCVLVQADDSEEETQRLLDFAAVSPFVKAVVGWVDLAAKDVEERLGHYTQNRLFKGIRHTLQVETPEFVLGEAFQAGIGMLNEFGLTYDLLVLGHQLPTAAKLAGGHPDQAFVLDHMSKPSISLGVDPSWEKGLQELARHENTCCKVSGFLVETAELQWEPQDFNAFFEVIWNAFGEDRLLYGSDWPVCLAGGTYRDTVELVEAYFAKKGERVLEKIMGLNAARFYGI